MGSAALTLVHACDSSLSRDHFLDLLPLKRNLGLQIESLERHLIKFLKHLGGENGDKVSVLHPDKLKLVILFLLCQLRYSLSEVFRLNTIVTTCLKLSQKDSKVSDDLALPREDLWHESHKDLMRCDHSCHEFSRIDQRSLSTTY